MMDLRERREKIGISISNVSRICGFPPSALTAYEKGLYGPRPERAAAMALLYGCSVEDLYYSVEESRRAAVKKENDLQCILRLLQKASDDTKKQVRLLLENA